MASKGCQNPETHISILRPNCQDKNERVQLESTKTRSSGISSLTIHPEASKPCCSITGTSMLRVSSHGSLSAPQRGLQQHQELARRLEV
jgi:hypothetical protein